MGNKRIVVKELILEALESSVDGYLRVEDFLYNTHIYARGYDRPLKKSNLSLAIKHLREKGYVDKEKEGNRLIIKLTRKGKDEAILNRILKEENWDGNWRVVVFDIPEDMRKVRNVFRSRLKIWGFYPWQKSVWISKKDIKKPLSDFIKEMGLEKWVKIFESEDLEP